MDGGTKSEGCGKVLHVQKALREIGPDAVQERYFVKYRTHKRFPHLFGWKYTNQLRSAAHVVAVQRECRGLILDSSRDWGVVAFPFYRFFNAGEKHAAAVDWSTASVQEKVDGTLMIMYHYNGKWHVGTGGSPSAGGTVGFVSFSTLFWRAFEELGCQLPAQRHTRYTFMFELCSPSNPVVVRYGCTRLVALGCRNRETFLEDNVEPFASLYNWAVPTRFKATSLQEVQAMAQKLSGTQAEGYVVCDAEFNRLKVKVPQFVALAHMSPARTHVHATQAGMVDVVRANEQSEFLAYFPQYRALFDRVKHDFDQLCSAVDARAAALRTGVETDECKEPVGAIDPDVFRTGVDRLARAVVTQARDNAASYFASLRSGTPLHPYIRAVRSGSSTTKSVAATPPAQSKCAPPPGAKRTEDHRSAPARETKKQSKTPKPSETVDAEFEAILEEFRQLDARAQHAEAGTSHARSSDEASPSAELHPSARRNAAHKHSSRTKKKNKKKKKRR